jgi:hypothetical protein
MRFLLFTLLALTIFSCTKDKFTKADLGDHSADYAFPLFTTDLVFKDLIVNVLDDSSATDELIFNADNTIRLVYSSEVASKKATEIFKWSQLAIPVTQAYTCYPLKAPDGVDFKKANIKKGNLIIGFFYGNTTQTISGTITIDQMRKNGIPFKYDYVLPPNPNAGIFFYSPVLDIKGNVLQSTNDSICFK